MFLEEARLFAAQLFILDGLENRRIDQLPDEENALRQQTKKKKKKRRKTKTKKTAE